MSGVGARPSASIILVRDGAAGLETFMVRRHAQSAVAPSAYVFPGGTLRADDAELQAGDPASLARTLSARSDTPVEPERAVAYYACAIRELFEEAGVLLAYEADGHLVAVDEADLARQEHLAATRLALQGRQLSLQTVVAEHHWRPACDQLVPFSHWVTPEVVAARFDARFFVAQMPARQAALHCTIETTEGVWLTPAQVLDGAYHVVYATAQHLRRLVPFGSVAALLAFAQRKPIRRVQPRLVETQSGRQVSLAPGLADAW